MIEMVSESKKRVAIFQFWNVNPHLETSVELAARNLDFGNKVYYLTSLQLPFNEYPANLLVSRITPYQTPIYRAMALLNKSFENKPEIHLDWHQIVSRPKSIMVGSIQELAKMKYEGFKVGYAILASLTHLTKKSNDDLSLEFINAWLPAIYESCISTYISAKRWLKEYQPDYVITFNGRFSNYAAIASACEALGISCLYHEAGTSYTNFSLTPFAVHNTRALAGYIEEFWESSNLPEPQKSGIAEDWFEARKDSRQELNPFNKNFTKAVEELDLPKARPTVSYFPSSDDEWELNQFSEWTDWSDQLSFAQDLITALKNEFKIVIRLHPNLQNKSYDVSGKWLSLVKDHPSVTLIMPNAQLNTYSLMDSSSAIVVSGSTVGLEGLQSKIPVVSYGNAPWLHHPKVKKLSTYQTIHSQICDAIQGHSEIADELYRHSIKFGFFFATFKGIDFKYYHSKSKRHGDFMGLDLFTEKMVA